MDKVFVAYETAKENTIRGDFIDRLHSRITVVFLFAICILVGFKQYEGNQIFCWLPHQFSDDQGDYTHQLCWVNNTYYYPNVIDADLFPESNRHMILYYQYILFIVLGQALMFYLPTMIWNVLSKNSIGYIKKLLDQTQKSNALKNFKKIENEIKSSSAPNDTGDELKPLLLDQTYSKSFISKFKSLVSSEHSFHHNDNNDKKQEDEEHYLDEEKTDPDTEHSMIRHRFRLFKRNKSSMRNSKILSFMKPTAGVEHLTWHYMFLKILNLINVVIQMILLNYMFGGRFLTYGIDFFVSLMNNENPFFLTTQFPVITFCDFLVYQNLHKIHYNAAQCILPINVLIEKFFLLVWFWYYLLIILTLINIFSWSIEIFPVKQIGFLNKYLKIRQKMESQQRKSSQMHSSSKFNREVKFDPSIVSEISLNEIVNFHHEYFGSDGLMMLHLIKSVAGDIVFLDLLSELWNDHIKTNDSHFNRDTDI